MEHPEALKQYRKIVAVAAVVCIIAHLLFCCFFTLAPDTKLAHTKFGIFYQRLVLLGPFFSEDRVQSSSHLYSRYKFKNPREGWSALRDHSDQYFKAYLHHPWQLSNLVLRDYYRYVGKAVSRDVKSRDHQSIKRTPSFKKLHNIVLRTIDQPEEIDSIQVMCVLRWYVPSQNTVRMDTLFTIDYKPSEVESPQ